VAAGVQRLVGQRPAKGIDRGPAEQMLLIVQGARRDRVQHLDSRAHDLRADAVAGEEDHLGHRARTLDGINHLGEIAY
jgi:hypothetical protein